MMVRSRMRERPLDARQRPGLELADEGGFRFQNTPGAERGFGIGAAVDHGRGRGGACRNGAAPPRRR